MFNAETQRHKDLFYFSLCLYVSALTGNMLI